MHVHEFRRQFTVLLGCAAFAVSISLRGQPAPPGRKPAPRRRERSSTKRSIARRSKEICWRFCRTQRYDLLAAGICQGATRYPVVYLLHGFLGNDKAWLDEAQWADAPKAMDRLITAGKIREMIVVMPDGSNKLFGSFYTNSVTTGNWEDFITQDLRRYVDSKYRTIQLARARGIAGSFDGRLRRHQTGHEASGNLRRRLRIKRVLPGVGRHFRFEKRRLAKSVFVQKFGRRLCCICGMV